MRGGFFQQGPERSRFPEERSGGWLVPFAVIVVVILAAMFLIDVL